MLAAFGLGRLELWVLHAPAAAAHPAVAAPRETTDGLTQTLRQRRIAVEAAICGADAERLPTRTHAPMRTNTEFPATRYANRV